ncbi:MAG: outer membrane beta-barrel protein [Betaproteobacteria bacterium]|nr:outer membrane beta-barrel protein [Betaproteobacteria bacterium]
MIGRAAGLAMVALATTGAAGTVQADEGSWMVRARVVRLQMANKSDAIPSLSVPADAIEVNDKTIPELDISYFFTKNIAAELILSYPQKQDVTLSGTKIGTFKHLPPTLTAQYHFLPDGMVRPYVGAGINYTRISSVSLNVPGVGALDLDSSSVGGALQVGVDVRLAENLFLNVDLKKIYINSDVKLAATGAKVSTVKLDPVAIGVGIGYRF